MQRNQIKLKINKISNTQNYSRKSLPVQLNVKQSHNADFQLKPARRQMGMPIWHSRIKTNNPYLKKLKVQNLMITRKKKSYCDSACRYMYYLHRYIHISIIFILFQNIIKSANTILNSQYQKEWKRIKEITGHGVDHLLQKFDKYIAILAESQHDTYTSPFEIVTSDMGMNIL